MADEAFRRRKGEAATALRRDTRLTAVARVVGLELMAWWSEKRPNGPIYGRTTKYFCDTLGFSDAGVRNAMAQLELFGHFRFARTGRADLAWPTCVSPQLRSLNFSDQIAKQEGVRASNFGAPIKQDHQKNLRGDRGKRAARFVRQEGDNQREREISASLGPDGDEVLSALFSIDGGRPYEQLLVGARHGPLSDEVLADARQAAMRPKAVGE
jgi:hypothetical protein